MVVSAATKITNLSFTWPGAEAPVLQLADLEVKPGEHLFVQGASGSGKSTLLGLLSGVLTANSGRVEVLGKDLGRMSASVRDHFRAHHIGYIFQQFNLVPYLSVVENVTLPLRFSTRRHQEALKKDTCPQAAARRLLDRLGMNDFLDRKVTELSVGQQQRVAAAGALIGSPEIILADEPTSALDRTHRESFIKLLFEECREAGITVIFVSHDEGLSGLFARTLELRA
jgi:putative ABC transport system ATP-binding protein